MAVASSSTMRALRRPIGSLVSAARYASTADHTPAFSPRPFSRDNDGLEPVGRPPRPASPVFFTGKPAVATQVNNIVDMLKYAQDALRVDKIYPLPSSLTVPQAPAVRWKTREAFKDDFGGTLVRMNEHNRMIGLLNELHRVSYLAELAGKVDLADKVSSFLSQFMKPGSQLEKGRKKVENTVDGMGRAHGAGKRKTASARVWILPSKSALPYLDEPTKPFEKVDLLVQPKNDGSALPVSEVIVNHLPLPAYFRRVHDRENLLRPLRLTGLLGAYNVFALVQGGGTSGQSQAISLALARALVNMRGDVKDVLYADGALVRNPKSKERKKTNLLGARAARTWVKR